MADIYIRYSAASQGVTKKSKKAMVEVLPESNRNLLLVRAVGKLTHRDYKDEIIPRLESIIHKHGKIRFLIEDFTGWEIAAFWDDARIGLTYRTAFERIGIIGAPRWVAWALKLVALVVKGEIRIFAPSERSEALSWITASP
ncbi:MAG: STAS/SEC14 domain-containing protein [Burkholderiales bacterium]|nr:STAS/SEC14 domain-containing protein [Burkholderiales bacterium]